MTSESNKSSLTNKYLSLFAGPFVAILFIVVFNLEPENPSITYTLGVAIWMAIWWMTEALPLGITALLPVVMFPLLGVADGRLISSVYFNHLIFLFLGGFMVALAMEKWNLHKRIAIRIILLFGLGRGRILLGFMVATYFLSMWISNTASAMMMVPVAFAVILHLEKISKGERTKRYAIGLLLAIAYSASIGGIATLIGTPSNLSFVRIYEILFPGAPEISFSKWFSFALPLSVIMLLVAFFLIYYLFGRKPLGNLQSLDFHKNYKELGPVTYEEKCVLVIFLFMALLWITRTGIEFERFSIPGWDSLFTQANYLNDGTVAIAMAVLLFMIPSRKVKGDFLLDWQTARKLPWNIVLLFGGGFALATGFVESGLSMWLGEQLHWLSSVHPFVITLCIALLVSLLTELTSNTATVEMLLPIIGSIALSISINPLLFMIPATIASSLAFMLPVATPPNAIVFGTSRLTVRSMASTGVYLNFIGILLVTIIMFYLGMQIFGISLDSMPGWAIYNNNISQ